MLLYSPRWLFFYPGVLLMAVGLLGIVLLLPGPLTVGDIEFDVHTLLIASTLFVSGFQLASLAVFARLYASRAGFLPRREWLEDRIDQFSLEYGLIAGVVLTVAGILLYAAGVAIWAESGFGALDYQQTLRVVIPGSTLVLVGLQTFFYSFLISLLSIK
jgi:hypothetical protein